MGNAVVINASELSDFALKPIVDTYSSFEMVLRYARDLPDIDTLLVFGQADSAAASLADKYNARCILRERWNMQEILKLMNAEAGESERIFYIFGDTPLLDIELSRTMLRDHIKYFAQYSFADGYPHGLTPEIISTGLIPAMLHLAGEEALPVTRDGIFTVIQKDINAFEIETALSPRDMRLLRISLSADSKRNFLQMKGIIAKGGRNAETVMSAAEDFPELLRTLPAYVSVQVTAGCPQSCTYCPYPKMEEELLTNRDYMEAERFREISAGVAQMSGDAVIGVGLFGEPSLHPRFEELAAAVFEQPALKLLIETSGIGWNSEMLRDLAGKAAAKGNLEKYTWIVSLDSLDQAVYNRLRGDGFYEALETARLLMELFPGRVWVQAVRMRENEEVLEDFYRQWKKETEQVIIQKYDTFSGFLPERKVADLSPVNRFPCWHVKRDIAVRLDGTVPLCREDIRCEYSLGNIFSESLESIWDRGNAVYREHIGEAYNPLCENCDEYYTYNF